MDFEERMNRIVERHEALAQSQELLIASTRESFERLEGNVGRLERSVERQGQISEENSRRMGQLMETMNRLANIVISHEDRLDEVDHRLDEIEGKAS